MIKTSYFANLKNVITPVSISSRDPDWYHGYNYRILAPKVSFLLDYKKGKITSEEYTVHYNKQVLDLLDPEEVYKNILTNFGSNAVLLCYEKPGDFCHRRLVAEWFTKHLNVKVPEIGFEYEHRKLFT